MDFFAQQDEARRQSRWLVLWFLFAASFVVAGIVLIAILVVTVLSMMLGVVPGVDGIYVWRGLPGYFADAFLHVAPPVGKLVASAVTATILWVTGRRMWQLSDGGPAVAELLGAHYLERSRVTPAEARLLNVVEEMAIAAGIAVPPVYLLASEDAVNCLVAGHTPNEAVIVITRGAINKLSRDELQGVIGHEFSHILNGDMALNLRLVSLLAGLGYFGEKGEELLLLYAPVGILFCVLVLPSLIAAEAVKAAVSRHRELLADAASVQFTRNPDGIAGALDSIRYLKVGTTLRNPHVIELSHMFFVPAYVRWWAFPSHPPIEERIRRAHPHFMQEDYRRTRHAATYDDGRRAVLDGAGNIVKVVGGIGTAAMLASAVSVPKPEHVDHARRLLERLPQALRRRLATPKGAQQVIAELLAGHGALEGVGRHQALLLIELALPALKQLPQKDRDAFLVEVNRLVQVDGKVTLSEFVQATLLHQHLRAGASKPIPTKFRKVEDVALDAHVVLSLIAHASNSDAAAAHAKGRAILGIELPGLMPVAQLATAGIGASLERLRHLDPFAKPRVLKACLETAAADGVFRLAEAELVRAVAATLDCPLPPVIGALDPATLAA